ncbi:MAG: cytochrome b N-terminal domain-containing protein [Chloroflexota bacterium]|nr:cytochrome b N-terminal domain-containing protein [Chloroflexota bacterium]
MKIISRRTLLFSIITAALVALFFTTSADAAAPSPNDISTSTETFLDDSPPPPNRDSCLHCHIKGEESGVWTPLSRWIVFGTAGLIFAFGVVRSISAWKTRSPWKPLVARTAEWVDERYKISGPLSKVLKKPIPEWQRRWWYCLGGLTAFLFIVQAITGVMLAFYYKPTPEAAYASIQFIETEVRFGSAIRAIHHWAANGMVLMVVAHMVRVFVTGAFRKPRELNWVSGVVLFIVTLGFGFTGYLLPWDQRAYWATTVGTEIAGSIPVIGELALLYLRVGWNITSLTLSRFFALHVLVFPAVIIGMMGLHFIMVRRQGIHKPL